MSFTPPFGRREIEQILPHREPFLLLDEVVELEPGARVVARKLVRDDEWYLAGHFPGRPIMPGVLMVEAMAQAGAVAALSAEENRGKLALFAGIDDVRFKRIVVPGDELELSCELERVRGPVGRGKATASVGGKLAGGFGGKHRQAGKLCLHSLRRPSGRARLADDDIPGQLVDVLSAGLEFLEAFLKLLAQLIQRGAFVGVADGFGRCRRL